MKTKAQQRVEIAKDVIKHLNTKALNATTGNYVDYLVEDEVNSGLAKEESIDFTKIVKRLLKPNKECGACALGSLFLTTVDKFNDCKVHNTAFYPGGNMDSKLLQFFTKNQLNMIEHAFEGYDVENYIFDEEDGSYDGFDRSNRTIDRLNALYNKHENSNDRLRAIMENIIRNNGTFKP